MVNFPYRYVPVLDSVGGIARHDRSPGWWLHKTCSPVPRSRRCAALHQKKGGWNLNSDIGDIYYVHICICIYIDIWRGYLISYIYIDIFPINGTDPSSLQPSFSCFGLVPQPLANHPMAPDPRWYLVVHQSIAGVSIPFLNRSLFRNLI